MVKPFLPLRDQRWHWRSFGSAPVLVNEQGAQVILSARGGAIETRDPADGLLRPVRPGDAVFPLIEATPWLLDVLLTTERNLGSLIAATHSDAVLMTKWRDEVRRALAAAGHPIPTLQPEEA